MGPFASRLWGFCLVCFAPARSCQESPHPSAVPASMAAKQGSAWPSPVSVATADPGRQLLAGAASSACGCLVGAMGYSWPRLVQVTASHAASQPVIEQEYISQNPCLISPGDCWCLKPSIKIFIWLAVRVSKMPGNLRNVFSF